MNPDDETTEAASDVGTATTGSGDGGPTGTPSELPDEEPPSADQEANEAVSGGGMVQPSADDDEGPKDTAERTTS